MAGETAKFSFSFESDAAKVSNETANALEGMRRQIAGSQDKIRELAAAQARLRGSTDEVVAAKAALGSAIAAERTKITEATLAITKQGTSYEVLAARAKAAAAAQAAAASSQAEAQKRAADATKKLADAQAKGVDESKAAASALKSLGGPAGALPEKFEHLSNAMSGLGTASGAASLAVVGLVGAFVALTGAALGGLAALLRFVVTTGNAARTQALHREALLGSAEEARNFGDQIADVARRVPLAQDEIEGLGDELYRGKLRGQDLVDAMNAVAQVTAAKGKQAGDELKKKLIDQVGVGAREARIEAEKELGAINARGLLDLNAQAETFWSSLRALAKDVNLEPLLSFVHEIVGAFDQGTSTGAAMHDLVTAIGNGFTTAVGEATPFVKQILKGMVIGALQAGIAFLQLRRWIRETFGGSSIEGVNGMAIALTVGKAAVTAFAIAIGTAYVVIQSIVNGINVAIAVARSFYDVAASVVAGFRTLLTGGWSELGAQIVTGLASGVTGAASQLTGAVQGVADRVKSGFKSALGISSPSKVFAEYGEHTAAGFAEGVEGGTGDAQSAVTSMAGASAPAGGGGAVTINLAVNVAGGGGEGSSSKATSPDFHAQLLKAIEEICAMNGLRVLT